MWCGGAEEAKVGDQVEPAQSPPGYGGGGVLGCLESGGGGVELTRETAIQRSASHRAVREAALLKRAKAVEDSRSYFYMLGA